MPSASKAAAALSLATLLALTVVACSGPSPQDEERTEGATRAAAGSTEETVFDDMLQTQDRARAVEGVTLGHKQDLDRALEASEGDAPDDAE